MYFDPADQEQYSALIASSRSTQGGGGVRAQSRLPLWPHTVGRGKHGEFPLVVAAAHFRARGYSIWYCEPALDQYGSPDFKGFMLLSYPGRRAKRPDAYVRMRDTFGAATVAALNAAADDAKRRMNDGTGTRGGGDPDLFVFNASERFFVEVKWKDAITAKQRVTFPLIERYCGVKVRIVRIAAKPLA